MPNVSATKALSQIPPLLSTDAKRRVASFSFALIALGIGTVLYWVDPGAHGFYPRCLFHQMTGLNCPGCGSTRAVHQLMHGNIVAAFHLNALLVASAPLAIFYGGGAVLRIMRAQPLAFEIKPFWIWIGGAILLVFTILRNLPFESFAWLRP